MQTYEYLSLLLDVYATQEITRPDSINHFGTDGWELIHMERVGTFYAPQNGILIETYNSTYFCIFKRPTEMQSIRQDMVASNVADKQPQQFNFKVIVADSGRRKVDVIRAVTQITGLSLGEANKLLASKNSIVLEGVSRETAVRAEGILVAAGATVVIQ